jgi:hypothetical protein
MSTLSTGLGPRLPGMPMKQPRILLAVLGSISSNLKTRFSVISREIRAADEGFLKGFEPLSQVNTTLCCTAIHRPNPMTQCWTSLSDSACVHDVSKLTMSTTWLFHLAESVHLFRMQ